MNVPVQVVFLLLIWILNMGHLDFTFAFAFTYFAVSMVCVSVDQTAQTALLTKSIQLYRRFWH